jgi:hypothetical protein
MQGTGSVAISVSDHKESVFPYSAIRFSVSYLKSRVAFCIAVGGCGRIYFLSDAGTTTVIESAKRVQVTCG